MSETDNSDDCVCLDFANTWGDRSDPGSDTLTSYRDLLHWARRAEIVSEGEFRTLERLARRDEVKSSGVFQMALDLRDTIFGLFSAAAAGQTPSERVVADLNAALDTVPRQRLCCSGDCCEWEWPADTPDLRQVLWPVVRAAAELATSSEVSRIRECAAPDCNWLFLDSSRGGRRRWCDMATCGNRAKARRYYDRHRRNK
ncbi:MAG: CGNR zinc finger domain-containing protein [Acidobacteria bacterium]|jgi:predicted RNA-binding Zn ribbon-like protein|nr:CGNR zinc finger domain-containing protein [Acidobacteriota bacterium]